LKENRWIEEVEEELQIEMPLVSHTFVKHMSGSYNEQLPGFADQQCSILGCKIDYDEVVLNLGTGGQLAQLSDKLDISENFQVRPFFDDKFIKTITHLPSGRFVNSIIRIVKNQKQEFSYKELDEIAHSVVLDSTLSQKELSSFEAQYQRKEIDTFEFLTHSISYIINNLVQNYKSLIPKSDTKIKIAGGLGQKMTFIKKLLSDRLDVEITISPEMETTLKGLHSLYLKQVRDAV
jgi:hypothetical protein